MLIFLKNSREELLDLVSKMNYKNIEQTLRFVAFINKGFTYVENLGWIREYYPTEEELKEFEKSKKEIENGKYYTIDDLYKFMKWDEEDK